MNRSLEYGINNKLLISALVAISLTTGNLAFAQGNRDRDDRGRNDHGQSGGYDERRDHGDRRDYRERHFERGAGPNHSFHRGGRLPSEYRHRHYVINDWRGHHLSAPPRGHYWVQTGGDYLLVAIASGIIVQLVLH